MCFFLICWWVKYVYTIINIIFWTCSGIKVRVKLEDFISYVAFLLPVKIRATGLIRVNSLIIFRYSHTVTAAILLLFWCHPRCSKVCIQNLFTCQLCL